MESLSVATTPSSVNVIYYGEGEMDLLYLSPLFHLRRSNIFGRCIPHRLLIVSLVEGTPERYVSHINRGTALITPHADPSFPFTWHATLLHLSGGFIYNQWSNDRLSVSRSRAYQNLFLLYFACLSQYYETPADYCTTSPVVALLRRSLSCSDEFQAVCRQSRVAFTPVTSSQNKSDKNHTAVPW